MHSDQIFIRAQNLFQNKFSHLSLNQIFNLLNEKTPLFGSATLNLNIRYEDRNNSLIYLEQFLEHQLQDEKYSFITL